MDEIYKYCQRVYNKNYATSKKLFEQDAISKSPRGTISKSKAKKIEADAQLEAIKLSIIEGSKRYKDCIPELWNSIYRAHLYRKSGINNPDVIDAVITAEQSWRAASGHAFEAMIKELGTLALTGTSIKYVLQADLNLLLKAGELANQPTDVAWLEKMVDGDVFDLYVIAETPVLDENSGKVAMKPICFGTVQCKTSIRDRVSRDIDPSRQAMESKFWSVGFVLDGTMFSVPKYVAMVNGNEQTEFKRNGWHGMYVLSASENTGRIYAVDPDFSIVRSHTVAAWNAWKNDRMGFLRSWTPE